MSDIVIFEGGTRAVEVRLEGETLWLTQRQMGELFGTTPENVLMHLRNIYAEQELEEVATAKDFLVVRQEGSASSGEISSITAWMSSSRWGIASNPIEACASASGLPWRCAST